MEKIVIRLKKYTYTLEKIPSPTSQVAGCLGCFFCKKRGDYYTQTCCEPYSTIIGSCGSILKNNATILRVIKKERNEKA